MAVGGTASPTVLNQSLQQLAIGYRDLATNAINFFNYVNNLGLAGLQAIGFSLADATTLLQLAGYMNSLGLVYQGSLAQPQFNFNNALIPAWGGS